MLLAQVNDFRDGDVLANEAAELFGCGVGLQAEILVAEQELVCGGQALQRQADVAVAGGPEGGALGVGGPTATGFRGVGDAVAVEIFHEGVRHRPRIADKVDDAQSFRREGVQVAKIDRILRRIDDD